MEPVDAGMVESFSLSLSLLFHFVLVLFILLFSNRPISHWSTSSLFEACLRVLVCLFVLLEVPIRRPCPLITNTNRITDAQQLCISHEMKWRRLHTPFTCVRPPAPSGENEKRQLPPSTTQKSAMRNSQPIDRIRYLQFRRNSSNSSSNNNKRRG